MYKWLKPFSHCMGKKYYYFITFKWNKNQKKRKEKMIHKSLCDRIYNLMHVSFFFFFQFIVWFTKLRYNLNAHLICLQRQTNSHFIEYIGKLSLIKEDRCLCWKNKRKVVIERRIYQRQQFGYIHYPSK